MKYRENPDFETLLRHITPGAEFRIRSFMNAENRPALSVAVDGRTYEFVAVGDNLVRLPAKPPTQAVTIPGFDTFISTGGL